MRVPNFFGGLHIAGWLNMPNAGWEDLPDAGWGGLG